MNVNLMNKVMSMARDLSDQARSLASIKVRWSDSWGPEYDHALAALPEMPFCSHELYRKLALNPTSVAKRFALLSRRGEPIAIIGLRRRIADWMFLTDGAVPWCTFPAKDGEQRASLAAINTRIHSLQRVDPSVYGFRNVTPFSVYRADLTKDFERHWRNTDYYRTVKKARTRTQGLCVRVDVPDDLTWVIRAWMDRWHDDPLQEFTIGPDNLLASHELLQSGRMHVVALADGDRLVGGMTLYVHENDVVMQIYAWDQSLAELWLGTRVIDAVFQWAASRGFHGFDLGGYHNYKRKWAPIDGQRYASVYEPAAQYLFRRIRQKARTTTARLASSIRWQSREMVD